MTPGLNNPNLSGLGLPVPLTDAVRQAFFAIYSLQSLLSASSSVSGSAGITTIDVTLTSSGGTQSPPSGAGQVLFYIIRPNGHTFSWDPLSFSGASSNINSTAGTLSTFLFVKSGALYYPVGADGANP